MIRFAEWIASLRGWRATVLSLGTGAIGALAMPPLDLWPALVVAVPVFLVLVEASVAARWRTAFFRGWFFGLGYFLVALHWIGAAFLVDAATYLWMMPFAVGGLAAFLAVYWGLATLACRLFRLSGLPLVFGFSASMGIAEWLRGHLFTGFPWAALGLAVDGMPGLDQLASIVGMTGLSLLIALWSGLPLVVLRRTRLRHRLVALSLGALFPVCWLGGLLVLNHADSGLVANVRLRLVQPNIGQEEKWREDNARQIFDKLLELSSAPPSVGVPPPNIIIWPESAVPFLIDESRGARIELGQLLGKGRLLVTGAIRRDPPEGRPPDAVPFYNSVIVFNGEGQPIDHYDKWRLVPGGEFLPLAWILEPLGFRKIVTVPGSFTAGQGPSTYALPGVPSAAFLICYEVIFPDRLVDRRNRPHWIINVTNDGWFGTSSGPYQHLAQARLRAIEQGLPVIRVANTGISAVVDGYGRIRESLPLARDGIIDSSLPNSRYASPYSQLGDWTLLFIVFVVVGLAKLTSGHSLPGDTTISFGQGF